MRNFKLNDYDINIFQSNNPQKNPIIYTHLTFKDANGVVSLCPNAKFTLVSIEGVNWNKQLTPWIAKRVFKNEEDFAGEADAYINILINELIPEIESTLGFKPDARGIVGYSLAGLFSLYSLYKTDLFNFAGSISGSLWYNGFVNYIKSNEIHSPVEKIYLSLGDKEKSSKNHRIKQVEEATISAEEHFKNLGINTIYEKNEGNHFTDSLKRIVKGINWLIE